MSQEVQNPDGHDKLICQSDLLIRGWTKTMIRDLLPTPHTTRLNPHYQKAAPMKLYAMERVIEIEATDAFKNLAMKAERRRVTAKESVATKRDSLLEQVDSIAINVPVLPEMELVKRACDSYNAINAERGEGHATVRSAPFFLQRICVNYLRHECSSYEAELDKVAGKVAVAEARSIIREKVYDAIAEAYPELAEECSRQNKERQRQDLHNDLMKHG